MAINGEVQWKFTMGVVDQAEKIEHVDSKNEDEPVHPQDRRVWASYFRRGRHDSVVVSFGFRGNRFETQLENIEDTPEQTSMSSFIPPKQMPSAAEASHFITLRHDHILVLIDAGSSSWLHGFPYLAIFVLLATTCCIQAFDNFFSTLAHQFMSSRSSTFTENPQG